MNDERDVSGEFTEEDLAEVREAALRILDYGDNTRAELIRKLIRKGYDPDAAEIAADSLENAGLVNDVRYARLYTQLKTDSGKGPLWIRRKLREKGVPGAVIDDALMDVSDRETERRLCLRKALDVCGLRYDFDIDEKGRAVVNEGSPYEFEKVSYFEAGESGDADRRETYKKREKEKARLVRKLSTAGFSTDAVFFAVGVIESL